MLKDHSYLFALPVDIDFLYFTFFILYVIVNCVNVFTVYYRNITDLKRKYYIFVCLCYLLVTYYLHHYVSVETVDNFVNN